MTVCDAVLERVWAGSSTEGDRQHAKACPRCRPLFPDAASEDPQADTIAALVAADRRWAPSSTVKGVILALAFAAPLVAAVALGATPGWPALGLVLVAAASASLPLSPIHRAPPPRWALGVALLAPLLTLYPWTPTADALVDVVIGSLGCLVRGLAAAAFVLVVARVVDARAGGSARWVASAALWGGLSGAAAMELMCPMAHPAHRIMGHGAVAWLAGAGALALARTWPR